MHVFAGWWEHNRADAGFSLVEVAVSLVLVLTVAGAAGAIVGSNVGTGRTEPEVVDVQQRARAGADLLARDLYMAGAGVYLGPATGSLRKFFAPVVPRRMGLQNADSYVVARPDAITIAYVPQTQSQTALRDALLSATPDLRVQPMPNCPPNDALCGFAVGSSVLVFDREGHFDMFTLTQVLTDAGRLRPWQQGHSSFSYPAGAVVSEAQWHTYYFDAQNRQLRHFDGYLTDTPVVDDVVGVTFAYYGDPLPPRAPKPPSGTANCLYDAAGSPIEGLATLPAQGASLTALPLALFSDGPWCGDGDNRFDADLLRIRAVRVTLRLQVGNEMMRGRSSEFAVPGKSLSAARSLPDYTVRFDVSPRNMTGDRRW
jgi:hypothetical protein